jgi:uncharacterized protein YprB with RNaseH-like and TPR domain
MRFADRLAQVAQSATHRAVERVDDRSGRDGFSWKRFAFAVERALGHDACAPGFERVALPSARASAAALLRVASGPCDSERPVVAVDLETAGLFGPVVPFIACAAWHEGDRVVVEQWTLEVVTGERAFLRAFGDRLHALTTGGASLLSWNGGTFDLPRLRERMGRLGLSDPSRGRAHLDLIVAARRLYKGVHPDCRLTTLEQRVLGIHRRGDLGGAEVAALFGRMQTSPHDPWLREELALAARHNRADVLGLLALLVAVADALGRPKTPADAARCARHDLRTGRIDVAIADLLPHVRSVLARARPSDPEIDAVMLLASLYRSEARHDAAAELWRFVCERCPGHAEAHEALAKHLEHRRRSPAAALRIAAASARPCPRRLARLRKKVAGRETGAADPDAPV